MAYKVIFAPAAIARLEDIVRYIAADDPGTAETFALHLINRAELLADFPELGTRIENVRTFDAFAAILTSSTIE